MATYTSFLNLEKPTTSETFNLLKLNQNWDKIDQGVSSLNSNIGSLHNVNMTKDSVDEIDKPWLVIKRLFSSLPVGIMVGTIECAGYRSYFGFKSNDSYGVFYVDMYSHQVPPYKVVINNGVVRYSAFTMGTYETA